MNWILLLCLFLAGCSVDDVPSTARTVTRIGADNTVTLKTPSGTQGTAYKVCIAGYAYWASRHRGGALTLSHIMTQDSQGNIILEQCRETIEGEYRENN